MHYFALQIETHQWRASTGCDECWWRGRSAQGYGGTGLQVYSNLNLLAGNMIFFLLCYTENILGSMHFLKTEIEELKMKLEMSFLENKI